MTGLSRERDLLVRQLFARLTSAYGQLWSSRFSERQLLDAAVLEWGIALQDRTPAELSRAVQYFISAGNKMPPTLPEFVAAARPRAQDTWSPRPKALAAPEREKQRKDKRRFVAECREVLK